MSRERNPVPGFGTVLNAQLRMLALLQRRDFLVLAGILAGLMALAYWGQMTVEVNETSIGGETIPVFMFVGMPLLLVSALWPLGVWRHDEPSRRGYFWSMPIAQGPHTLARLLAGWLLLLCVVVVVMVVAPLLLLPSMMRFEGVGLSLDGIWVPLLVTAIPYLVVSALMIAFDHPLRMVAWILAGFVGLAIVSQIGDGGVAAVLFRLAGRIVLSFGTAILGPIFRAMGDGDLAGPWALNYLGWLATGLALCVGAAYRRRDVA